MLLVLVAGGVSLSVLAMEIGSTRITAAIVGFLWASSLIHVRTTAWWSAFVQTQPCSVFLFTTIALGLAFKRTEKIIYLKLAYLGTILTGLSYEMGYLIFVPMLLLFTVNMANSDPKISKQLKNLFLFTSSYCLLLIVLGKLKFAAPVGEYSLLTFFKSVGTFLVVNISILFNATINKSMVYDSQNIKALLLVLLVILILFVLWIIKKKAIENRTLVVLILSSLYSPVLVSYGRSQFEPRSGIPGYPTDLQYHSLMFGFLLLVIAHLITSHSLKFKQIVGGLTVFVFVMTMNVSQSTYTTSVNRIGGIDSASTFKDTIFSLPESAYPINSFVPFVLQQFGEYGSLQSVAPILGVKRAIGSGRYPYLIDDFGVAKEFNGSEIEFKMPDKKGILNKGCSIVFETTYLDVSIPSQISKGSLVLRFQSIKSLSGSIDISLLYSDQVFPMGSYPTNAPSIGFQLPVRYINSNTISEQPLLAVRVLGLAPKSELCISSIEFLNAKS
jgi:hypothetical protein